MLQIESQNNTVLAFKFGLPGTDQNRAPGGWQRPACARPAQAQVSGDVEQCIAL